jgi:hypothetical protein
MFNSKGEPMTFIAVRCPHCQSEQIVKRGKTRRGTCDFSWHVAEFFSHILAVLLRLSLW